MCGKLKGSFGFEIQSNVVSKKLLQNAAQLEKLGVQFEFKRSHGKRWIEVRYERSGDGSTSKSDGKTSEITRREKGVNKPRKKKGSKPKSKKGARRKARRRAKSKK